MYCLTSKSLQTKLARVVASPFDYHVAVSRGLNLLNLSFCGVALRWPDKMRKCVCSRVVKPTLLSDHTAVIILSNTC